MAFHDAGQNVAALFRALSRHARPSLEALRDTVVPVHDWAANYGLSSLKVEAFAEEQRLFWASHRIDAKHLRTMCPALTGSDVPIPAAAESFKESINWEPHEGESLREFRERVTVDFRQLRSLAPQAWRARGGRPADPATVEKWADWFVLRRVNAMTPAQILAKLDDVDRDVSTVLKGVAAFADLIGAKSEAKKSA